MKNICKDKYKFLIEILKITLQFQINWILYKIFEMEQQSLLTLDDLKCCIWDQLPFEVYETECCGMLVCQNWNTIKKCPKECGRKPKGIKLFENRFLQRIINNLACKCEFWQIDISRV